MGTKEKIIERLGELEATRIDIVDESEKHSGHAGARDGGHYLMTIVSNRFSGQGTMARHRLIYGLLSDMMKGEIHALALKTYTSDEYQLKHPT